MTQGIVALSLFDGMGCGYQALKRAGVRVREYHAFENDKHAISIAKKNHPDIIHHGEINFMSNFKQFAGIDFLLGGSPCQGFSFIGKQVNFKDPRSMLFFEYVRARKESKAKNFILENVRMKKQFLDVISEQMAVSGIMINSRLVSAQNRPRWYWTNIKGVDQPSDRGIVLNDILQPHFDEQYYCTAGQLRRLAESTDIAKKFSNINPMKAGCMTARQYANWKGTFIKDDLDGRIRRLTEIECERLQNLPDNYTQGVPSGHRYKMLGNGWNINTIVHILSFLGRKGGWGESSQPFPATAN